MVNAPIISIIIPTKNEERFLPGLLKSIKKQTLKNIEIIIADANSTDKTKIIAKREKCKIINGGLPDEGRNNGAKISSSKTLLFLDSDIILPSKNFLERLLSEFKKKKLDLAGVYLKSIKTEKILKNLSYSLFYNCTNLCFYLGEKIRYPFMQSCMLSKKIVYNSIGGFPPYEFGEDSAFAQIAIKKGFKFGILKETPKVLISPRRFEKEGFFKLSIKYIKLNFSRLLGKEYIRNKNSSHYWS